MDDELQFKDKRLARYLNRHCCNQIFDASKKYINNPDYDIEDIDVQFTILDAMPNLDSKGYLGVDVYYKTPFNEEQDNIYLYMTFEFNISSIEESFTITDVSENKYKVNSYCYNSFIPKLSKEKMIPFVYDIFEQYYNDYQSIGYVDASVIAKSMGLRIKYGKLSEDSSIFGLICMNDVDVVLYNTDGSISSVEKAQSGDIYIDKEANYLYAGNEYKENFTIMHECIHWYLHRKYFYFMNIINKSNIKDYKCETDFLKITNEDLKWIEWQATSMASLVLLPEDLLLPKYEELYNKYYSICNDRSMTLSTVIDELSQHFKISREAIKIRLNELGKDVVGIYEFIDRDYVSSYSYKQGYLKERQSFSARYVDMFNYIMRTPEIYKMLDDKALVILDHHLIINNKKYIQYNNGCCKLTNYALNHMDECALPFDYKIKGIKEDSLYRTYILCSKLPAKHDIEIKVLIDKKDIREDPKLLAENVEYETELLNMLPRSNFGESLRILLKHFKITQEKLGEMTTIPRETINRYINNPLSKHTKSYVIAICVALKLPYNVTIELLNQAGTSLSSTNEDRIIDKLLMYYGCIPFNEFRDLYENYIGIDMISVKDE